MAIKSAPKFWKSASRTRQIPVGATCLPSFPKKEYPPKVPPCTPFECPPGTPQSPDTAIHRKVQEKTADPTAGYAGGGAGVKSRNRTPGPVRFHRHRGTGADPAPVHSWQQPSQPSAHRLWFLIDQRLHGTIHRNLSAF